ncbi:hypothetical protein [Mycobacterium talmoniae]|uniref:Tetracyclin repressor-like C-terminal domain-containing protein n=2 Tax=Mycobacterium talmoniae TaxID=1858794 RepID=A0A1S1NMS3_9MYCO|nr:MULTISPECIES: hypothetical protein [Mycobacterium]OHV05280.1 hypothetical protein BKN37_06370 [Mycobacterium talmoniae]TDH52281.1 hypothetical protein E2F47_14590 [Mycobacterium eburneum]
MGADDQPELLAGVEHQPDGEQVDLDVDDLASVRLLGAAAARSADDAALRAGLVSSMVVGLVVGRRIVGVPVLANADLETLVALLAPAVQNVLTSGENA